VGERYLIVTADDYGIGPATSQGILDLAGQGRVSATVLLVNSPYAAAAVGAWRQAGAPVEMGWHPCLTLDRPVLPAARVPSLVDSRGYFRPLGPFLRRLCLGWINPAEIEAELRAQYLRFVDLVGRPPAVVNSHHHIQVFPPVGACLLRVLGEQRPPPYVRRVREPWGMLARVPGARLKRAVLSALGRRDARTQQPAGFPGNAWLAVITDPPWVADPDFLVRWLGRLPGTVGELTCHPGRHDQTLVGRDCTEQDGQLRRRTHELERLRDPSFLQVCRQAGWALVAPSALAARRAPRPGLAA
jgi:predicted glycoside hydrolase/deacetylase ChbG (UPF0249 family)